MDTVAGMASSVVDGALSAAKSAAAEEVALQLGLEGDLEVIKDELELFQTFLVSSDEERGHDPVARVWARQVRDVAYDVEDYIEDFAIHLGGSSWWWCSPSRILNRRRIAAEMKKLRARVGSARERRTLCATMAPLPARAEATPGPGGFTAASGQEAAGLDKVRLIEGLKRSSGASSLGNLLARPDSSVILVSVCARTTVTSTLIGQAYDELAMTGQFQSRAWVTVPHPFNLTEFIRSLLRQFHSNSVQGEEFIAEDDMKLTTVHVQESIETMGIQQLVRSLARNLQDKRYLLVIDGISTREEWDSIRLYFRPDVKKGSRIIVTSGTADVAKYCAGAQSSTSFSLFGDAGVLSAFCNVDSLSGGNAESSSSTSNHENVASTSSEIEESGNNSRTSAMATVDRAHQFVGREKEMDWLISKIRGAGTEKNNIISVYGMRGIGKTAFVHNAYHHKDVRNYFTHHAWVTVSSPLREDDLLCRILQDFKSDYPTSYSTRPLQEIRMELAKFYEVNKCNQSFRCLVVVDGLSTTEQWDLVKSSLILEDYNAVLQILVTTRQQLVANYCSMDDFVHNLVRLHEVDARKLFYLKVFGTVKNVKLGPDMDDQAKQILSKCGGIPFAIINIARHLASRPRTAREWQRSNERLNLDLLAVNPDLGPMKATLESCYSSLPYYFKYCFLYLSIFQEDMNIMRRRLVKRWIAEGYVRGIQGSEAEEVGERVFNEFLSMTIIQPTRYTAITSGRVSSCSVHPLMLEVSTSKATEEKLVCMLDCHNNTTASMDTIRHVLVRRNWRRDHENEYKSMNLSRVRSLTVFGEWRPYFLSRDMRMLRVLDLEGTEGLKGHHLRHIGKFRHLKYLGLRSTQIEDLPKSLGKLRCLETLDIRYTNVKALPSTIIHLKKLRVVRGGLRSLQVDHAPSDTGIGERRGGDPWGIGVPRDIGELRALNTLGTLSIRKQDRLVVQELRKLTQLQRLSITGITDQNGPDLCSTLQHLSHLRSLAVHSPVSCEGLSQSLWAHSLRHPMERLEVLKLYGYLPSLPEWISGLRNLSKLYLHNTRLKRSSYVMNVLALLPNLTILLLLADSIMVPQLTFEGDTFKELELLELAYLPDPTSLALEAGAMPMLKTLQVVGCKNLEELSVEAGAMPKLESLQIEGCDCLSLLSFQGAGRMPMLKKFQVGCCNNLELLEFRTGDMPNLETILVRRSYNLWMEFEAEAVPKLKMLQICRCRKPRWLPLGAQAGHGAWAMPSSSIEAGAMPNLETLRIEDCAELSSLSFGCGSMPKLETLTLIWCKNLEALSFELGATPNLDTLKIIHCHGLNESVVSGLRHLDLRSNVFE